MCSSLLPVLQRTGRRPIGKSFIYSLSATSCFVNALIELSSPKGVSICHALACSRYPYEKSKSGGITSISTRSFGGAEDLVTPGPPVTRRRAVAPLARSLFLPKVVAAAIACSAGLGGAAPRCEASGFPNLWLSRSSSALASSNAT